MVPPELPPAPRLTEADRASQLARWHGPGGAGAGLYAEYVAAKGSLRDKKAAYAATAAAVNDAKGGIDKHVAALRAADAAGGAGAGAAAEAATALAAAKTAYRAKFEELSDARAEVEYLQRVNDQLGARVAAEFQRYWVAALQAGGSGGRSSVDSAREPAPPLTIDAAAAPDTPARADHGLGAAAPTSPVSRPPAAAEGSRAAFDAAAAMVMAAKASPPHAAHSRGLSSPTAAAAAARSPRGGLPPALPFVDPAI